MQFTDLRTLLELPKEESQGGCNLTAAVVLFNLIAGSSVCFYEASAEAFSQRGDRGKRFLEVLKRFYPWNNEELASDEGAELLYESARNPLGHSLGLDPPRGGSGKEITLRKWALSLAQITELEDSGERPTWARKTISDIQKSGSTVTKASISVPALYWGVHRMLRALFADAAQLQKAEASAADFSYLWPQYRSGGAFVTVIQRGRR